MWFVFCFVWDMCFVNVCCGGVSFTCHVFVVESGQRGGARAEDPPQGSSLLYPFLSQYWTWSCLHWNFKKGLQSLWKYSTTKYQVHIFGPNCRISKRLTGLAVPSPHPTMVERTAEMFCGLVKGIVAFLCTDPIRPSGRTDGEALPHLQLLPAGQRAQRGITEPSFREKGLDSD